MDWTESRCSAALEAVERYGTLASAAESLSKQWKVPITREMIKSGLYRARKRQTTSDKPDVGSIRKGLGLEKETLYGIESPPEAFPAWKNYSPKGSYSAPTGTKSAKVTKPGVRYGVIIPDTHVPCHDVKAWATALAVIKEVKPSFGVIIGDFMDMGALSRHPRSTPDITKLSEEYYATNMALDDLQTSSPDCEWTFLEGNHEYRAVKYMNEQGNLSGMLEVPQNLYIHSRDGDYHRNGAVELRGMKWISTDDQPLITAHSAYYHGIHYTNKHHAASNAEVYSPAKCGGKNIYYGHMHVFQSFTNSTGSYAQCCGFLGNEQALGYLHGKPNSWTHGIVVQQVTADNQVSHTEVRIRNGKALFEGREIVS